MRFLSVKTKLLLFTLLMLWAAQPTLSAQDFPKPMSPPRLVNDYVNLLDQQQFGLLESKLRQYNDSTSTEIAIVIVQTIGQDDIDLYGAELAQEWGIGKGQKDNGVLILVAVDDRQVSISTGYGLEGAIPDAYAKRIIEKYITPNFRENRYFEGLDQATSIMMSMASGEFKADPATASKRPSFFLLIVLFFFVVMPIISVLRGKKRHLSSKPTDFWTMLLLMSAFGGGRGNSYDDFRSGGGDFGGFGGGGFGGGGASGDW